MGTFGQLKSTIKEKSITVDVTGMYVFLALYIIACFIHIVSSLSASMLVKGYFPK